MTLLRDLAPNDRNPRKITSEKLKMLEAAIEKFGSLDGVIFNETTKRLVGGHQRQKVDKSARITIHENYDPPTQKGTVAEGYVTIKGERFPYRVVRWDEDTEKAANIAANKGGGEWDIARLSEFILELDHSNFDLDLTMFDAEERENIVVGHAEETNEGQCDPDEVPEAPKEARSKRGDLYTLGRHRLLCGDSTDRADVERLMAGEKADMVFTDPPYGIGYQYNEHDDSSPEENSQLVAAALCSHECGKVWTPGKMNLERDISRFGKAKIAIWYKKFAMAGSGLGGASTFEPILVLNPKEKNLKNDVLVVATERETLNGKSLRELHSCPKPVELFTQLLEAFTLQKDKVAEPFCGSGTTLIACEKTNRRCFGMEIDPHYCDVIVARWEKFTGKKAVLEGADGGTA